ncbi:MAG TPA: O-antigen ligase family protein, partial [Solirubrobacterales bacterium]
QSIDSWPRTRRPLPWLFAGFLASIFLVPVDAIQLKVHLPFSSDYDRFFVAIICVVWAIGVVMQKRTVRLRLRPRGWALPVLIFFGIAVFSIVLNIGRITNLGELDVAEKRLALLVSMFAVFAVFAVSLRVTELRNFAVLIVVLASITSLGTIYEQKTGENLFYTTAGSVLGPIAEVAPGPTEADANGVGRPLISGPTRHALSVASLLGMAVPFAVMFAAMTPSRGRKLLWGLIACLIVAGALVTQRRSGLVVPLVAVLSLFAFRPRKMLPLLPWAVVACAIGLVVSGGSISAISQLTGNGDQASTEGRTSDYEAVVPDLLTHPAFGRGYGTLDSIKSDTYRIFDNEYLGELYQVGLIGLLAFLALIITPVILARSVARSDNPFRGPPALAAVAGIIAFAVAASLYDILTFPQAPYLFLFLAAMCITAASEEHVAAVPARLLFRRARVRGQHRPGERRPVANVG